MDEELRPISANETRIFERLLECEFPGREEIRRQLSGLQVTPVDDNGWLGLKPARTGAAEVRYCVPIEGSYPDQDGALIHILLHVVDGYISDLEVFKEDGSKVVSPPLASKLKLFCPTGGEPK
jgi:hypothetical protein